MKYYSRGKKVFYLIALLLGGINHSLLSQSPCMPTVPSYTINLTGNPAGIWSSPNIARNDQCCLVSPPNQCIYFNLTLDPNAAGIQIDMIGADPPGSLFYNIGCTGSYPGGTIKCISGVGPHQITFCKPGSNKNIYKITSISKPLFPKDDTVRIGCKTKLVTLGIVNSSVTWQSIYPGTPGQYNNYLDSTNVASPTYSPTSGAPTYIDYKVCGFPIASGCGFSLTVCDTVRIYNYSALTATVTPNPATYCNIGPGSGVTLNASASGGLVAYNYTWSNSSNVVVGTGSTYFANTAGTYNLQVTDQLFDPANCPAIFKSVSVSQGTVPIVDAGPSKKVCASNPVATVTGSVQFASGGIWSGGSGTFNPGNNYLNISYTPSPAELAAGFVKLYLTSSGAGGGCVNKIDSTYIYYSSSPSVTITSPTLACHNSTTTLNANVTGGTNPYTYLWNTGSTNNNISGGQGNYSVLITDSLGCIGSNNYNLIAPSALNISFGVTNVSVNGGNDGSATVTPTGGTAAYTVTWTPGNLNTLSISNLIYGVYTATVTDANGCEMAGSTIVNEPRCLAFTANATSTNVLCNGTSSGMANVMVSGGTPAYTYTWNTSPVQNTPNASNLNAGVYTVLIKDASNCYQTANVTITEPTLLINTMTYTNVTIIGGNNGATASNPFGGVSPYSYLWNTSATTSSITNLFAGSYTVNITDKNGCVKTDSVRITQPPCNNLTLNVLTNNVLCFGGNNGSALAVVSGATGSYTISWSTSAFGPSITGLGAGNYSVNITDSKNCVQFVNFSITQTSLLSIGLLPVNVRCNGTNDGSINLTVSGGTYPYTFAWSNASTSEDLVNLSPGSYSVQISDAKGCSAVASAVITEPSPIAITYTSQNVSCIYGNNGAIGLNVTGGTVPYTYTWSTGSTSQNISNLTAGGYTVSIKDANNCSVTAPLIIPISQPDSVKVDSFIVACSVPGSGQTQVTVIPSGGYSGIYQVSFNNGVTYQPSGVYTTMLNNATTYSVIVKDMNNCLSLKADTLTLRNEVKIDSVTYGKCYAVGTTAVPVIVYPSGGNNGPYMVSYDNGSTYSASGTYSNNLAVAATYSVIIKDGKGCVSGIKVISLPAVFDATTSITSNYNGQNISCNGMNDGSALVIATGGSGAFSYIWNSIPTQTTSAANNLTAGSYSVVITDGNSCSITKTITLTQPTPITSTASVTSNYNGQNISCFGYSDGTATVTPNGGTAPYTYAWNSIPTQTNSLATGLSAGIYSVVVTDINNCAYTTTVVLTQPASITSTLSITSNYNGQNISCFGMNDGSATITASNGTPPFTYTWSTSPVQTGTVATGLAAGTYSVIITDANGCNYMRSISLTQPNTVTAITSITSNYNGQNISCFGYSDASASVTPIGGTTPYTYSWNSVPSQTTASATNLSAGNYSVSITDINGCNFTTTVSVLQPPLLNVTLNNLSNFNGYNVSCFGSTNGNIDITAIGGTGALTYTWSNGSNTQDLNNITAGNYSVIVTDVNGCTDTLSATLTQPNTLVATIDSLSNYNGYNISCHGSTNGAVYVTVNGGVTNYSYQWNNGSANQDLTNVGIGSYTLSVVDLNNCYTSIDTMLSQPPALTFSYSVNQPLCNGVSNGSVDISVGGGINPYTYNWSNNVTSEDLSNITAGTYTIEYADKNGCKDSATIIVNQPQAISLIKKITGLKCYGDTIGNIILTTSGGILPYSYNWSNGATTNSLTGITSGTYIATITDVNGCILKDTTKLSQPDSLYLSITSPLYPIGYNISSYNGNDGLINLTVNGGTSPYTYLWSNGNTSANISDLPQGHYFVTVTDTNGCRVFGDIILTQPLVLEMPTGFSPNNDGKNDLFVVHGIEAYPDNTVTVYNRWGNIVYSKTGYKNEWDGVSNNGQMLPDATYFVILEINKGEIVKKGFVELRR